MAYTSWSVVFGEQPSAAKWNQLGTNDALFDSAIGVNASGFMVHKLWRHKIITSASTQSNVMVQSGWDRVQGTSTSTIDKAITFPTAFDTILSVVVNGNGFKASDPVTIDGSTGSSAETNNAGAISVTGFTATVSHRDAASNLGTSWYAFSWLAVGTKA